MIKKFKLKEMSFVRLLNIAQRYRDREMENNFPSTILTLRTATLWLVRKLTITF